VTEPSPFTWYIPSPVTVRVLPASVAVGSVSTTLPATSAADRSPALSLPSTGVVTGVWNGVWSVSSAAVGCTGVTVTAMVAAAELPKESVTSYQTGVAGPEKDGSGVNVTWPVIPSML